MRPTPRQIAALGRRDPALGAWMRALAPFPGFPDAAHRTGTHYEALARAIVFQQLAGAAAATIHARVCALTPGARFPQPGEIATLDDAALRAAGLSAAKVAAVRDLAARVESGRLRLGGIGRLRDDEIVERLVEVRGIGVWSAQMFLLFRLGRLDVLAPGDLGLQEGLRILEGLAERPGPRALEACRERWSPLCSVASWTLWRLVEHERARRAVGRPAARAANSRRDRG
ncbi:MAG: DNA-3-methyladenine glycosylase 2 family protein [Planctomycetes bacterium]|nr:DNA-3-methyladenine glycosylase 2 family protein [Planctomycetota bacterium]